MSRRRQTSTRSSNDANSKLFPFTFLSVIYRCLSVRTSATPGIQSVRVYSSCSRTQNWIWSTGYTKKTIEISVMKVSFNSCVQPQAKFERTFMTDLLSFFVFWNRMLEMQSYRLLLKLMLLHVACVGLLVWRMVCQRDTELPWQQVSWNTWRNCLRHWEHGLITSSSCLCVSFRVSLVPSNFWTNGRAILKVGMNTMSLGFTPFLYYFAFLSQMVNYGGCATLQCGSRTVAQLE
jgi:hypothetical protein